MGFNPTTLCDPAGCSSKCWAAADSNGEQEWNVGLWLGLYHTVTQTNTCNDLANMNLQLHHPVTLRHIRNASHHSRVERVVSSKTLWSSEFFLGFYLTHWLLERLQKVRFLDILVIFRLDLGQISFNLVENAFATQQLTFLATSTAFQYIVTQACVEIKIFLVFWTRKWPTSLGFSIFGIFFHLSFFSFSFLFAAVIDLLLGLLAVKKLLRKRHRDGQFLALSSQV